MPSTILRRRNAVVRKWYVACFVDQYVDARYAFCPGCGDGVVNVSLRYNIQGESESFTTLSEGDVERIYVLRLPRFYHAATIMLDAPAFAMRESWRVRCL